MSSDNKKAEVLNFWRAVELFSPQAVPKVAPNNFTEAFFPFKEKRELPWEPSHRLRSRQPPPNTTWRFQVYCGIYGLEKVRDILEERLGHDPESFDERGHGESCLFAFSVSNEGRPLFDTYVVSTCAWALGRTISPGPESERWLAGFEEQAERLAGGFTGRLAVLPGDERGKELVDKGFNVGRPISYADILQETEIVARELGVPDLPGALEIRIRIGTVASRKEFEAEDQDFLNSFFIRDLDKIRKEVLGKNIGEGLQTYLAGDEETDFSKRIDVRKSVNTLFEQLAPKLFPEGRWPSKGHHPLVFSQQFAVNSISEKLAEGCGIFSVNGPPGTGKTTLLRDLIAAVLVERAKRLSELRRPGDAFAGERRWVTSKYTRVISLWKKGFKGFEIVVASSNNGAVENVTLEIPGLDAVDHTWHKYADYFPDFAGRIIAQPAWAMVAARLGNKANRNEFLSRFWYEDKDTVVEEVGDDDDASAAGFLNLLKSIQVGASDWEASVKRFKAAIDEERRLRLEREKTYQVYLILSSLIQKVRTLETKLKELEAQKEGISEKAGQELHAENNLARELERAKGRRLEHRQFRPGLLEILFSFRKAFREWREKDKALETLIEQSEALCDEAKKLSEATNRELAGKESEIQSVSKELDNKRRESAAEREKLVESKIQFGEFLPVPSAWQNEEESRELSSPWSDPVWNDARTKVFLEALRLHKAFIAANADRIRKSLHGAMDVLEGTVPETASLDGVHAAWTTLFFVIPVISTTFASFDRLFSHLGRESLGWLLIDEAGQAVPQAAVGAIWRAKRTVVVGDPLQLEPIVTLPFTAQQALRRHYKVEEAWLPGRTSTQQLADRVTRFGTRINVQDASIWVGAPLRVHRRCDRPMFDISNEVAYDGLMVFGTIERPPVDWPQSAWIDVKSDESDGHWIPAEGSALKDLLRKLIKEGASPKDIFLISPFRDVVSQLRQFGNRFEGIKTGTIHTAQGKESDVVILVLGGDPKKPGAKKWASGRPNLLNVAASRAKRRLYVIGNRELWKPCPYFNTAEKLLSEWGQKDIAMLGQEGAAS